MRFGTYCIRVQHRLRQDCANTQACLSPMLLAHTNNCFLEPKVLATFMLLAPLDSCASMFKAQFYAYAISTKIP